MASRLLPEGQKEKQGIQDGDSLRTQDWHAGWQLELLRKIESTAQQLSNGTKSSADIGYSGRCNVDRANAGCIRRKDTCGKGGRSSRASNG